MMPCLTLEECIRLLGHIQAGVSPTKAVKTSNVNRMAESVIWCYSIIICAKNSPAEREECTYDVITLK